ncbi:MAG: beta-propeller fold lactonase family protein, partial [Thermoanaerobaculia bacterium]|nr:beta-propeller fold lactonase family protein [Thermoanaerobaculia bacterium]
MPSEIEQPADIDQQHEAGTCPGNAADVGLGLAALPNNDACRDIDLLAPKADLELIKSDGYDVAIPGEEISYTITVINDGPSNVVGATIEDDLSAVFPAGAVWTCVAAPSGTLTFLGGYRDGDQQFPGPVLLDGLGAASGVAFAPDGQHAYVTGPADDAVAVFAVDGSTGVLTFLEAELDLPAAGLDGATAVAVSPDGAHVYVAGQVADTVVVYTRDADPVSPTFGQLTWLAALQDAAHPSPVPGADLVAGLDQPVSLAFDALGEHLYVAASNSNSVTVLAREDDPLNLANFGKLTFVERQQDGVGNVDGLAGASAVAVSPDGGNVYATGANEDSIVVFARNAATGQLTYSEKK